MKASSVLMLFLLVSSAFAGEDIRSKVAGAPDGPKLTATIDPDRSIYGIPFGTTEDQFIAAQGKPTGYVRLNGAEAAMIYGNSHAFIFEDGKLAGIRITHNILDWKLSNDRSGSTPFDGIRWRLTNGIAQETSLREVRKVLGDKLLSKHLHQHYYLTDKARVELDFSHYTNEGDGEDAYRLYGILIRQGATAPEDPFPEFSFPRGGLGVRSGGLGIVLSPAGGDGSPRIVAVAPGTPAEKAGLREGMKIISVDGTGTSGKTLAECVQLMRGDAGTEVTLEVAGPDSSEARKVKVKRVPMRFRGPNPLSEQ